MAGRLLYSPGEGMSSKLPEEERKEPENKFSNTKTPRKGVLELRGKATIIPLYREARVEVPRFRP
jgi:hypothetical protein